MVYGDFSPSELSNLREQRNLKRERYGLQDLQRLASEVLKTEEIRPDLDIAVDVVRGRMRDLGVSDPRFALRDFDIDIAVQQQKERTKQYRDQKMLMLKRAVETGGLDNFRLDYTPEQQQALSQGLPWKFNQDQAIRQMIQSGIPDERLHEFILKDIRDPELHKRFQEELAKERFGPYDFTPGIIQTVFGPTARTGSSLVGGMLEAARKIAPATPDPLEIEIGGVSLQKLGKQIVQNPSQLLKIPGAGVKAAAKGLMGEESSTTLAVLEKTRMQYRQQAIKEALEQLLEQYPKIDQNPQAFAEALEAKTEGVFNKKVDSDPMLKHYNISEFTAGAIGDPLNYLGGPIAKGVAGGIKLASQALKKVPAAEKAMDVIQTTLQYMPQAGKLEKLGTESASNLALKLKLADTEVAQKYGEDVIEFYKNVKSSTPKEEIRPALAELAKRKTELEITSVQKYSAEEGLYRRMSPDDLVREFHTDPQMEESILKVIQKEDEKTQFLQREILWEDKTTGDVVFRGDKDVTYGTLGPMEKELLEAKRTMIEVGSQKMLEKLNRNSKIKWASVSNMVKKFGGEASPEDWVHFAPQPVVDRLDVILKEFKDSPGKAGQAREILRNLGEFIRPFNKMVSWAATVPNLPFLERNAVGAGILATHALGIKVLNPKLQADSLLGAIIGSLGSAKHGWQDSKILSQIAIQTPDGIMDGRKLIDAMHDMGFTNQFEELMKMRTQYGSGKSLILLNKGMDFLLQPFSYTNRVIELYQRLPVAISSIQKYGFASSTAKAKVLEDVSNYAGNYFRMSPFERRYLSDWVGFYGWMKNIIGITFRHMKENPAGVAAWSKLWEAKKREEAKAVPDAALPNWMGQQLPVGIAKVPGGVNLSSNEHVVTLMENLPAMLTTYATTVMGDGDENLFKLLALGPQAIIALTTGFDVSKMEATGLPIWADMTGVTNEEEALGRMRKSRLGGVVESLAKRPTKAFMDTVNLYNDPNWQLNLRLRYAVGRHLLGFDNQALKLLGKNGRSLGGQFDLETGGSPWGAQYFISGAQTRSKRVDDAIQRGRKYGYAVEPGE